MRRLVAEDGSARSVPEAPIDQDSFGIRALDNGSFVTVGAGLAAWNANGERRWLQNVPSFFYLQSWDVDERGGRVVAMTRVEGEPAVFLGEVRLDLGAHRQELFIEYAHTDGTPLRWWRIENPELLEHAGRNLLVMGASGRSYTTGIADPFVDVCGMRATNGVFIAAFD